MLLLSKSKYMVGLQCPKYLWMMFHDLDKIPEFDELCAEAERARAHEIELFGKADAAAA